MQFEAKSDGCRKATENQGVEKSTVKATENQGREKNSVRVTENHGREKSSGGAIGDSGREEGYGRNTDCQHGQECGGRCDDNGIMVFSHYHKYWADAEKRIKNPCFDSISRKILDLKEDKMSAICYFFRILDRIVPKGITICVVPSSRAWKKTTGVVMLGKLLASNGRKDKVCFLERTKSIPKLSTGGSRAREVHLGSIAPRRDMSVKGEEVLLLDDVTTTGNSLLACRDILLASGAREVKMLALGKAVWLDKDISERELEDRNNPVCRVAGGQAVRRPQVRSEYCL